MYSKKQMLAVILLLNCLYVKAQKISDKFDPIIKGTPYLEITEYTDGNYLLFGNIDYVENESSGGIVKVDSHGNRLPSFIKVFTNKSVDKVVVRSDGKILIQGNFTYLNGEPVSNLVLLNSDGSVDGSFSASKDWQIKDFIVQSTGKIVVVYNSTFTDSNVFSNIARLNADGSTDFSFSSNLTLSNLKLLKKSNSDKFLVCNDRSIQRLLPDGSIDNTFSFQTLSYSSINDIALQSDGKIVLSVSTLKSTPPFTMVHKFERYDLAGAIDNTFVSIESDQQILRICIRKNGKIAVIGYFNSVDGVAGNAMELNPDGTLNKSLIVTDYNGMRAVYEDSSGNLFLTGGYKKINYTVVNKYITKINPDYSVDSHFKVSVFNLGQGMNPIAIQSDGKLVVGGDYFDAGVADDSSKLIRINLNGSPDNEFKPEISRNSAVGEVVIQEDNKIIITGNNLFYFTNSSIGRLLPTGNFDNSFQIGTGPTNLSGIPGNVQSLKIFDSKIFVSGQFELFNGQAKKSLAILDLEGHVIGPEQNSLPDNVYIKDMEFQSDGKILLLGSFPGINGNLIRLNVDGSMDNSFAINTGGNCLDFVVDNDDNIYVVGNFLNFEINGAILKFTSDGLPDNSFDTGSGFREADFVSIYGIKVLENNSLMLTGRFGSYNGNNTNGILFINSSGYIIPFENNFEMGSYGFSTAYSNGILYLLGRFYENNGQHARSAIKILHDISSTVNEYKVAAISYSEVQLTWNGSFSGAENVSIERSTNDNLNYMKVASVAPNVASYVVNELTEAVPYYFRISGTNEFYLSAYYEEKDTTFILPQVALPATAATDVSFQANWIYEPGTDSCQIQVSNDHFITFVNGYENKIVKSGSLLIEGLEKNTAYQYRVRRYKNGVLSEFSEVVEVQIIVGVDDETKTIVMYPNPTKDYIVIKQSVPMKNATIYLSDGSIAKTFRLHSNFAKLDVSDLPTGVFIVAVSSVNNSIRKFRISKTN